MLTQANEILSGVAPKAEAINGTENSEGWAMTETSMELKLEDKKGT